MSVGSALRRRVPAGMLATLLTAACGGDDGGVDPGPPPRPTGTVAGRVTVEGIGVQNILVSLRGAADQSTATAADGSFRFTSVPAGSHVVTLVDGIPGDVLFGRTMAQVTISTAGQEVRADFSGEYLRTSAISGAVLAVSASSPPRPVEGVPVHLAGVVAAADTTDSSGRYRFGALRPGEYTVSLTAVDSLVFEDRTWATTLVSGQVGEHDFIGARDLFIATDSLDFGRVSLPFSARLTAYGGSGRGYVWSLFEGSRLPEGLELLSDGTIRGTPVSVGVTEFGVRVTDSRMRETARGFALRVCDGPLRLEEGAYEVYEAEALRPCGFFIRAPAPGAYYRIAFAETDARSQLVYDAGLRVQGPRSSQAANRVAVREPDPARPRWQSAMQEVDWARHWKTDAATAARHARLRREEEALMRRLDAEGRLRVLPDRAGSRPGADLDRDTRAPEEQEFRLRVEGGCDLDTTVTAELTAQNEHFLVYEYATAVDVELLQRTISYYSDHGAEVIADYFGGVGDVNGDGTMTVLVHPDLGTTAGYVWTPDMVLSQEDCPASNEMELIHIDVGQFEGMLQDVYSGFGTLVHEVKHLSSLYKRVRRFERYGGRVLHPLWIEEGTAEVAKEAASRLAWERAGGPGATTRVTGDMILDALEGEARDEVWGVFHVMARVAFAFTPDPNAITFEPEESGGSIYGSGWHFHRFLRDWVAGASSSRADDARFIRELNDSLTVTGVAGIEMVAGKRMKELLTEHAVAMTFGGSEDILGGQVPHFDSYDFPSATHLEPVIDVSGIYPWPVTRSAAEGATLDQLAAPLGVGGSRTFDGRLASSGIRVHDFRASWAGEAATFFPDVAGSARVIVARVRNVDSAGASRP